MKKHIELLAILHITLGSLTLIGGILLISILLGTGYLASTLSGEPSVAFIVRCIAIGLSIFAFIIGAPILIAGIGLLKLKSWARVLSLILAFIDIINFPFGTLVSIYTFWVLLKTESTSLFGMSITGIDIRD